jgi:hypothetical protein
VPSPVRTDRTDCPRCGDRVIVLTGLPAVDYQRDPQGTIAVAHLVTGAWRGRPFLPGDVLVAPEHRHRVHECAGEAPA